MALACHCFTFHVKVNSFSFPRCQSIVALRFCFLQWTWRSWYESLWILCAKSFPNSKFDCYRKPMKTEPIVERRNAFRSLKRFALQTYIIWFDIFYFVRPDFSSMITHLREILLLQFQLPTIESSLKRNLWLSAKLFGMLQ